MRGPVAWQRPPFVQSTQILSSPLTVMVLEETLEPLPGGLLVVTRMDACSAFGRTAQGATKLRVANLLVGK